jgi:hypothetical protein
VHTSEINVLVKLFEDLSGWLIIIYYLNIFLENPEEGMEKLMFLKIFPLTV